MSSVQGGFQISYTQQAQDDLLRLYDFLLARARHSEDLARAQEVIDQLREHVERRLSRTPYLYRHPLGNPHLRELVVAAPGAGYVVLYDITDSRKVTVIAVRHQLEDDYL
jgi:plasmid stabilization system protein ParE